MPAGARRWLRKTPGAMGGEGLAGSMGPRPPGRTVYSWSARLAGTGGVGMGTGGGSGGAGSASGSGSGSGSVSWGDGVRCWAPARFLLRCSRWCSCKG